MGKLIKRLFCKHTYETIELLHGDEITYHGGKRRLQQCIFCGKLRYM